MSLKLTDLVRAVYPAFEPRRTKLHLAQWNGHEHPLDVFEAGQFDVWQSAQGNRNFNRDYVVALIATPRRDRWLFAGLWTVAGPPTFGAHPFAVMLGDSSRRSDCFTYALDPVPECADLAGRVTVAFTKTARNSYRLFETLEAALLVSSLMDAPRGVPRFRGYRDTRLSWGLLCRIIEDRPEDWVTALSSMAGVYLITTPDGRQYVGSASGGQGIWGRWESYVTSGGHGDNVAPRQCLAQPGQSPNGFQFSILETADTGTSREDNMARESHWKRVLGTRATGLNLN